MAHVRDIVRAAKKVMDLYPHDGHAELAAAQYADMALEKGDLINAKLWNSILSAICLLRMTKPKSGVIVH
jgi:hypothetical protein